MSKTARSTNAEWRLGPQRIHHIFRSLCKIYEVGLCAVLDAMAMADHASLRLAL
jgi:hypothetical protein